MMFIRPPEHPQLFGGLIGGDTEHGRLEAGAAVAMFLAQGDFPETEHGRAVVILLELVVDARPSIGETRFAARCRAAHAAAAVARRQAARTSIDLGLGRQAIAHAEGGNQGVAVADALTNECGHGYERGGPGLDDDRLTR
ncbi:hypothetical protein SDC9_169370 [bioreactor metagenome]|uniref:Uncharacterized protein n=1 Tax=bioreactor metagenome TaxID=1076179 RepID=A0A645G549_9ZZZZ